MASQQNSNPHVVIIGGGFAGLNAAKSLRRAPVRVTLLDRQNYHLFQPLLYQVATAALNPSDIAYPLRAALRRQKNVTVLFAEAKRVDLQEQFVELDQGQIEYDFLVLAAGATHSYFGNDQWTQYAPGLKSVEDALEIRRRVYLAYEAAERESDAAGRRAWLTFVVVGGGPTGVELAGALAEIGHHTLAKDFRHIDPQQIKVILIEGQENILPSFPPKLSDKARRQLQRLGVEVQTHRYVTSITAEQVVIGEDVLPARTILWAAGVQASPLAKSLGTPLDAQGRVIVEPDLSVPGFPNAYIAGDLAHVRQEGGIVPGVCPAAIQQGHYVASAIKCQLNGLAMESFKYRDKGSLATIGRGAAVADLGWLRFGGIAAWFAWLFVHIFFLIGFRNRVWVLFGWAWSYVTYQRGARLITGKHKYERLPPIGRDLRDE